MKLSLRGLIFFSVVLGVVAVCLPPTEPLRASLATVLGVGWLFWTCQERPRGE